MSALMLKPKTLAFSLALALPMLAHAQSSLPDAEPSNTTTRVGYVVVKGVKDGTTEGSGSYTANATGATGLNLSLRETPQTITVVTDQEMKDFNLNNMDDVLKFAPGIGVRSYDSDRNEYYARGFAIQNFMYDGVPVSRVSSYASGEALSDMAFYDRVEVIKGSTGLTSGVGDPGATINLIRKKPTRQFQAAASASFDSAGGWRGMVDVGGALNFSGSLRARAVALAADERNDLARYQRETTGFYGILEASLSDRDMLTLGFDTQSHKPTASSWGGIPLLDDRGAFFETDRSFNVAPNWSHWNQDTRSTFLRYEHGFNDGWVLRSEFNTLRLGHEATLGSASVGFPNAVSGDGVQAWMGQYHGRTLSDSGSVLLNGTMRLGGRAHQVVLGGTYVDRDYQENIGRWGGYTDVNVGRGVATLPQPDWSSIQSWPAATRTYESGAYGVVRWNLADRWKVITGARWSRYRNSQGLRESGQLMPYLGTTFDLNGHFSAYASYTGIFKPQSVVDRNDQTLAPLEGNNAEVGVKGAFFRNRLNASLAAFQLQQDHFAVMDGMSQSGKQAYRAVKGVKSKGYELEVSGLLAPGWQVQAGYSHNRSMQDGTRIGTYLPENQFSAYTGYRFVHALPALRLGMGTRWQSSTTDIVPAGSAIAPAAAPSRVHKVPSYWVTDLMGSYDISPDFTVSANVSNVTDRKYYAMYTWFSNATYLWGQGRTYNVTLSYKF